MSQGLESMRCMQASRVAKPFQALTQLSERMALLGAFALETWSRLLVLHARDARARADELRWVAENMCALHGVRPVLCGRLPQGPCVLVANHLTYFDPLVLGSLVPLTAIAKREVLDWPVIGPLSQQLGTLYVTREDAHTGARCLREARRALERGVSVLVFPEGTTTRGEQVLPFKRGMFGVAAQVDLPVVPVCLKYERADAAWVGDDAFLPHYVKGMRHRCTRVEVSFLDAMRVHSVREARDVAERARIQIARALRTSRAFAAEGRTRSTAEPSLASA